MKHRDVENDSWTSKHLSRVRRFALVGLSFGAILSITALIFSPDFVQNYLLPHDSLDQLTVRAILRARMAALPVGLVSIAVCVLALMRPRVLLSKLARFGERGKTYLSHLPSTREHYLKMATAVVVIFCLMATMFILVGEVNEDEGWYLYAGRLVYEGQVPYRDFSYTQTPLLPYIYGTLQKLFGTSLLLGRVATALFGLLALLFSMAAAKSLAGKRASIVAGAAIAVNPFVIYHLTITKTYSLSVMLLACSLFLMFKEGQRGLRCPVAVVLLALATGIRLTVFPVLVLSLIYIGFVARKYFFRSFLASGLALASVFSPFFLLAPHATYFNIVGYHMARYEPQTVTNMIWGKVMALLELTVKFPFLIPFITLGIVFYVLPKSDLFNVRRRGAERGYWPHLLVFSSFFAIFLVHFIPGGALPEYHVLNFHLAAIFAGWLFHEWNSRLDRDYKKFLLTLMVAGLLMFSFLGSQPIHGVMDPRTSYINLSGGRLPLAEVSEVAQVIEENTFANDFLFTTHTFLAVEANRKVLPGMEMGIFSFYPNWSTAKAQRYHVINLDIIKDYIRSRRAKIVVITDRDFSHSGIYKPTGSETQKSVQELIEDNYRRLFSMDNFGQFGQAGDAVHVYTRDSGSD